MNIQSKLIAHSCHGHTLQLSTGLSVLDRRLVVTLLDVGEKEECVVSLYLLWAFKNLLWVGASTYQPINR